MIDAVKSRPFLRDARVLRLPPPVDEIVSHLQARGFPAPEIVPIEAGIEDSFMYLMGVPQEAAA